MMHDARLSRRARMEAGRDRLAGLFPDLVAPMPPSLDGVAREAAKDEPEHQPAAVTDPIPEPEPEPAEAVAQKPSPQRAISRPEPELGDTFLNIADDMADDPFSRNHESDQILKEMELDFDTLFGFEQAPEPKPAPPRPQPAVRAEAEDHLPRPGF